VAKHRKPNRSNRAVMDGRTRAEGAEAPLTRRRQAPHNLNFMLVKAQIAAAHAPTARNRRQLRIARRRFADRTTGTLNLQRWLTK
jgi:hypothetical protein